ncbi:MAG: MJ0042-type zinc finger domain-containing protein [Gemmata sp.]
MNNTCPSCGALYNVAAKDIGRRLKCKKCSTALTVLQEGLVVDDGAAVPGASEAETPDEPASKKKRAAGPRLNPLELLNPIGGVPGLLFGAGVVIVLFFTALQVLAAASNLRATEYERRLELDEKVDIRSKLPKGKNDPAELTGDEKTTFDAAKKKIEDEYAPRKRSAAEDRQYTEIGNKRSRLYEGYGATFGLMLVACGCLGFLLTERAMIMRVVAAVILVGMVLGLFKIALGAGAGLGAGINIG